GGSATGLSQTTDLTGVATVGSWTLGTSAGANSLTATASVGSATFHATAVHDAAGSLSVNAGEGQTATVGTNVSTAPSVLVTDQYGTPVSGVAISFSNGGNATTNASGIAAVGSWTLSTTAGANTLTASSTGLPSV